MKASVRFIDGGRKTKCPSDPRYPAGQTIDVSKDEALICEFDISYPAPGCGIMLVECECGFRAALSVAGRADDPRKLIVGCKRPLH